MNMQSHTEPTTQKHASHHVGRRASRAIATLVGAVSLLAACGSGSGAEIPATSSLQTTEAPAPTTPPTVAPTTTVSVEPWSRTYAFEDLVFEPAWNEDMTEETREMFRSAAAQTEEYLARAWNRLSVDPRNSELLNGWVGMLHPAAPVSDHERGPTVDWKAWYEEKDDDIWADDGRIALWTGAKTSAEWQWADREEYDLSIRGVYGTLVDGNDDIYPVIIRLRDTSEPVAIWVPWVVEVNAAANMEDGRVWSALVVIGTAEFRPAPGGGWVLWDPRSTKDSVIEGRAGWAFVTRLNRAAEFESPFWLDLQTREILVCGTLEDRKPLTKQTCDS